MQALVILAAAYQMFNPQVDIAHQHNEQRCIDYNQYESIARHAGARIAAHATLPNGTPIQFWVKQDKGWGFVLVKKVNGQPFACFYHGGAGWEETHE